MLYEVITAFFKINMSFTSIFKLFSFFINRITSYNVCYTKLLRLSPEHPLVQKLTTDEHRASVEEYIYQASLKSDLERTDLAKVKTGVFSGSYAVNPVNEQKIPIWIADYVLISYGTGAIMAVPAHDERDWEFAKVFGLPIIEVLKGGNVEEEAFTGDSYNFV